MPADDLRAAARRLADEGPADRPLWGVPFAVKGNIDVAGLPTTAACPTYAAGPAAAHATVVARLAAAGALPVGTTNLDQFATGLVGTRSPYGACHAVGHPGWVSGGSSSGSAVVVAQGDVPFALGTDTAGSGRVPAALNGIAALKPTRGRLSTAGVVPACRSLDCVGVFAATPAEAAAVAAAAAGPDPLDPWSRPTGAAPAGPAGGDAAPLVGVPAAGSLDVGGDAVAAAAHAAALALAAAQGWRLVEVDLAPFLAAGALLYGGAFVAERYAAVGDFVRSAPGGLDPVVAAIIGGAADVPAWRAFADLDRLRSLAAATAPTWEAVDALLLPVVPTTVTHAAVAADPIGANARLGTYTTFANLLDLCAAVAPVAPRADGHPWGVQLVGPAWADDRVAALAQDLAAASAAATPTPAGRPAPSPTAVPSGAVALVVAGAHLRGEALEHQVVDAGGRWCGTTRTARPLRPAPRGRGSAPARPDPHRRPRRRDRGRRVGAATRGLGPLRRHRRARPGGRAGRDGRRLGPAGVRRRRRRRHRPPGPHAVTAAGGPGARRARPADPGGVRRGRAGPVARGLRRIPGRCRADGGRMPVMTTERIEVPRLIAADAADIFRLLCDPQGHVAIDSSGMLMSAEGEPVSAVGDTLPRAHGP